MGPTQAGLGFIACCTLAPSLWTLLFGEKSPQQIVSKVAVQRMSGLTRILACIEIVPMVGPGEAGPNVLSVPAVLSMNHEPLLE
jgi:hypothetical protein